MPRAVRSFSLQFNAEVAKFCYSLVGQILILIWLHVILNEWRTTHFLFIILYIDRFGTLHVFQLRKLAGQVANASDQVQPDIVQILHVLV